MNHIFTTVCFIVLLVCGTSVKADPIIGQVQGVSITKSQVKGSNDDEKAASLTALFINPVIKSYLIIHKKEWTPTEDQIGSFIVGFNRCVNANDDIKKIPQTIQNDIRPIAEMMLEHKNAQKFIYTKHGGGRILFQQAGEEAFDATLKLILSLEQKGEFEFLNDTDRNLALRYWTTQEHHSLLRVKENQDQLFSTDSMFKNCP
jgi:hypothetical protein